MDEKSHRVTQVAMHRQPGFIRRLQTPCTTKAGYEPGKLPISLLVSICYSDLNGTKCTLMY